MYFLFYRAEYLEIPDSDLSKRTPERSLNSIFKKYDDFEYSSISLYVLNVK